MSAPIIIVLPSGSHLADVNAAHTWCGESTERPMATFELLPGSDVGEHARDCKRCVAQMREVRP